MLRQIAQSSSIVAVGYGVNYHFVRPYGQIQDHRVLINRQCRVIVQHARRKGARRNRTPAMLACHLAIKGVFDRFHHSTRSQSTDSLGFHGFYHLGAINTHVRSIGVLEHDLELLPVFHKDRTHHRKLHRAIPTDRDATTNPMRKLYGFVSARLCILNRCYKRLVLCNSSRGYHRCHCVSYTNVLVSLATPLIRCI